MERKARLAGYEISWDRTDRGYLLQIQSTPEHDEARQQVFALFDQLRTAARASGVTVPEILGHWAKEEWRRLGPRRK